MSFLNPIYALSKFIDFPHFFLFSRYNAEQNMISDFRNCTELGSPTPQAAQSLLMIVTTKPDENFGNFSEQVRKFNKQQPFNFNEPEIFNRYVRVSSSYLSNKAITQITLWISQHVPMYAAHLYDAVLLYATALGATLRERNLTDRDAIIEAAKDGRSLFKRIIDRRKYDSP